MTTIDTSAEALRRRIVRERETEQRIRQMDAHEIVSEIHDLQDERDRLAAENVQLREALQWFVDNDETSEGDTPLPEYDGKSWNEINAYWIDGLNRARFLLDGDKK